MIYKFKEYKLFENPDTLYFEKENIELEWSDPDAIAFLYIKTEFEELYDEKIRDKILISAPGDNHPDMLRDKYGQNYPSIHQMKEMEYIGRLWYDSKIISFWDYPETKEKLYSIIDDINKNNYDLFIIDDSWYIEIIKEQEDDRKYAWSNNLNKTDFVKIKDFHGSKDFSEEERKLHLMNATDKRKALRKLGYKPKHKSKNMIDAEYNDKSTKYKFTESIKYRDYSNIVLLEHDLSLVLLDIDDDIVVGVIILYPESQDDDFDDDDFDFGQVGSVGAERGYGFNLYKFALYEFWLKYKKPLMPSRDGDVKGEAMAVWEKLYNDSSVKKNTLEWKDEEFTLSIMFGEQTYYTLEEKEEIYQEFLGDVFDKRDLKKDEEIKIFNTEFILDSEPELYSELKEKGEKYKKNHNWKHHMDTDYGVFFDMEY